ncbi:hypothetical protein N665_0076s0109 [Sinapis alba]|nr:hypothetical protein N665_0076s0109 [Sinapis alba]KAF8111111.1 hypothetical protein N665_0076s0109 [Sinapis alba]KAF8111112.1 hypothetical protein N665_0076s0109 [Sinapis alba]KAF8111113.1 hypothetical protein N665_0076s0109 [Sinapis alba]
MYFFSLSKEQVLSQKPHVASYKETFKQNPVTLFGRQVYPVKSESSKSSDGYMRINSPPKLLIKDIDLRLPADHCAYLETAFETSKEKEAAFATSWSGNKRDPKIVIDLEELPTTEEDTDSVSYVTTTVRRSPETEPDQISSNVLKKVVVDQCLVEDDGSAGLLDLNRTPVDELMSEPHFCFLQDLNCPYIEETETSCDKSGVDDDDPTSLCSPKCQNVHEKDGTASPASYTSCCTTEHNVSRRGSLDPSCCTRLEFPVLPDNKRCNEEEEEFSEAMQMAAESLVHISAVSYQSQEFQDKPEKGNVEPRCCPCDSYELHTLGIRETNTEEEFCVSSMAMDKLNNITRDNNKEFGLKLRRGRRMKNFQKEILPSLVSLSRHEIREDMNILEAVLRSREYKKMQGKTKDVKLGANTRNKRSVSQRYVGKRR